jgi:hypothetical protein
MAPRPLTWLRHLPPTNQFFFIRIAYGWFRHQDIDIRYTYYKQDHTIIELATIPTNPFSLLDTNIIVEIQQNLLFVILQVYKSWQEDLAKNIQDENQPANLALLSIKCQQCSK